jgi:hypothetical protein
MNIKVERLNHLKVGTLERTPSCPMGFLTNCRLSFKDKDFR